MDILVLSHRHDCSEALANIDALITHLTKCKAIQGHAICLCSAPPRKLQIRATRTGRLTLAVWPMDGHLHHYACPFHRDEEACSGGDGVNTDPAIRETEAGFDIAPDFQLQRVVASDDPKEHDSARARPVTAGTPRPNRTKMGFLGILHHLWIEAYLNVWSGFQGRDWWRVTQALLPVLEQGSFGNRPMTEWLYLVPEFSNRRKEAIEGAWQAFRSRLGVDESLSNVRMGLILGEAKAFEPSRYGYRLDLRHFPAPLYVSTELREKLGISFLRAFHRIGSDDGSRVICLCLVEQTASGYLSVVDAALMLTSSQYIPVDSSHEAVLAEKLVLEKRRFTKPLKVARGDTALPDFVLTDTKPELVLEVFGMNTNQYLERKAEKLENYRREGKPVWSWTVDREKHPPRLPPPTMRSGGA